MYKREHGQSLVEFAVSVGLLLLILLGILDLGRVFHAAMVITNAAREGAYYGGMHPEDTGGIVAHVIQEAQDSGISLASDTITVSGSGVSGPAMCVTVEHEFSLLTSVLPGVQTILLRRTANMVIY